MVETTGLMYVITAGFNAGSGHVSTYGINNMFKITSDNINKVFAIGVACYIVAVVLMVVFVIL